MISTLLSQEHLQAGTRLPPTAQHLPSSLGCPSQNMDLHCAIQTPLQCPRGLLCSHTAPTSRCSSGVSLPGRNREVGACPRSRETLPKTDALRASTRSGNAATAGTEASPPPGTAWDVPAELREGAEPRAKNTDCDGVTRSHVEPSSSSSWADFGGLRAAGGGSSIPAGPFAASGHKPEIRAGLLSICIPDLLCVAGSRNLAQGAWGVGTAEPPNPLLCVKTPVQPKVEARGGRGSICSLPSTQGMCENRELEARDADFRQNLFSRPEIPGFIH